ncbi:Uncharacterized protein SCF082_LOCUS16909 [Durusdinium trenchii]
MADEWLLESKSTGDETWTLRRSSVRDGVSAAPSDFNAEAELEGWPEEPSRWVRLTMQKGHLDPWNFGVFFGLRSFTATGRDDFAADGARAAWPGALRGAAPGLWFALEHPRARCEVDGAARRLSPEEPEVWRLARCTLRLAERVAGNAHANHAVHGGIEVTASLGTFEDEAHSQVRRSFSEYLEEVRGWPFGQILHYNSWYDLRSPSCDAADRRCFAHEMGEKNCADRLKVFNGNLSHWTAEHHLDAFLLDDGWDNPDSLWEVDDARFPEGFAPLVRHAKQMGTRLGVWMSPFGGYGAAGARRVRFGAAKGFERSKRGSFALAGPKYFQNFQAKVKQRISEGFGIFKFDGLGGGLGQSGGEEDRNDFEAMLSLLEDVRGEEGGKEIWISLTIGTWPSPFWLLWGDSIWRDGPDVGFEGRGSARDRWLSFRDHALQRAHARGPLFPITGFMQHGVVWSKTAETSEMWPAERPLVDFCNEVLTFFLAGTGLQELYIQMELMDDLKWSALAQISAFARTQMHVLRDAHLVSLGEGPLYGSAALEVSSQDGLLWLRNPTAATERGSFNLGQILELPARLVRSTWELQPLQLGPCGRTETAAPGAARAATSATEEIAVTLEGFEVKAWKVGKAASASAG